MGTATLEDIAAASGDPGTLFFQLYVLRDRNFTREIVQVRQQPSAAACQFLP
jgi:isopentenyl diphosphate isomerase/L-lactate dehydrogenase-like FMN-dependent dehydrogenase